MKRIAVIGNCATGKSTLAARLARDHSLTHIELDGLFHGPDWTPTPAPEFQAKLQAAMNEADATSDGWTTCGNYNSPGDRLNQNAADTIIWLDLPRGLIMRRVVARTLRRAVTREVLWNGNTEPLTNFYKWDPQENIIRWTWTKFDEYQQENVQAMADGTWSHANVQRLCSPGEVEQFCRAARRHNES